MVDFSQIGRCELSRPVVALQATATRSARAGRTNGPDGGIDTCVVCRARGTTRAFAQTPGPDDAERRLLSKDHYCIVAAAATWPALLLRSPAAQSGSQGWQSRRRRDCSFVNAEAAPYAARRVSTRPAAPLFRATHRLLTGSTGADRCAGGSESPARMSALTSGVVRRSGGSGVRPASSGGRGSRFDRDASEAIVRAGRPCWSQVATNGADRRIARCSYRPAALVTSARTARALSRKGIVRSGVCRAIAFVCSPALERTCALPRLR